ncbi:MAG: type II toxin-antitoxin system VapB family antitoxin [Deltaproteobacteria bacterium]|nr:type II toxin-antitoxin system VapB family antitoxin [Deltaproteobacteria bacterium]
MRTNIVLKDDLVQRAADLSHIREKTALVHEGLKALIEKHVRCRLATLGASEKGLKSVPRRRSK